MDFRTLQQCPAWSCFSVCPDPKASKCIAPSYPCASLVKTFLKQISFSRSCLIPQMLHFNRSQSIATHRRAAAAELGLCRKALPDRSCVGGPTMRPPCAKSAPHAPRPPGRAPSAIARDEHAACRPRSAVTPAALAEGRAERLHCLRRRRVAMASLTRSRAGRLRSLVPTCVSPGSWAGNTLRRRRRRGGGRCRAPRVHSRPRRRP